MRKLFAILALVIIGYLNYVYWHKPPEPLAETPIATPAPVAVSAPAPQAQVSPTPPLRHLAPAGIYFLVQRVSITTDSGVFGDPPGTKVTMVTPGPPMQVTDGPNQFEVLPSQVTNDLDVAGQAYYADQRAQAYANARNAQQAAQAAQQLAASEKQWQDKMRAMGAAYAQPIQMTTGELDEPPKSINMIDGGGSYRSAIH
jgi:hypothetical protein